MKDENGNIVKQWNFANAQNSSAGMAIPVKELLQLQKANKSRSLALYYTANDRTEGEKLASLQAASKEVTYIHQQNDESNWQIPWQLVNLLFKNIVVV